jgi:hypothetical protein
MMPTTLNDHDHPDDHTEQTTMHDACLDETLPRPDLDADETTASFPRPRALRIGPLVAVIALALFAAGAAASTFRGSAPASQHAAIGRAGT